MAAFPALRADVAPVDPLVLRAAVSAYLGRYRGETNLHTESDLRVFLRWCTDQELDPLAAVRVDIERYLRWLQDVRRYGYWYCPSSRSAIRPPVEWPMTIGLASSEPMICA
jgi:integrase/recombinase XerD